MTSGKSFLGSTRILHHRGAEPQITRCTTTLLHPLRHHCSAAGAVSILLEACSYLLLCDGTDGATVVRSHIPWYSSHLKVPRSLVTFSCQNVSQYLLKHLVSLALRWLCRLLRGLSVGEMKMWRMKFGVRQPLLGIGTHCTLTGYRGGDLTWYLANIMICGD